MRTSYHHKWTLKPKRVLKVKLEQRNTSKLQLVVTQITWEKKTRKVLILECQSQFKKSETTKQVSLRALSKKKKNQNLLLKNHKLFHKSTFNKPLRAKVNPILATTKNLNKVKILSINSITVNRCLTAWCHTIRNRIGVSKVLKSRIKQSSKI